MAAAETAPRARPGPRLAAIRGLYAGGRRGRGGELTATPPLAPLALPASLSDHGGSAIRVQFSRLRPTAEWYKTLPETLRRAH